MSDDKHKILDVRMPAKDQEKLKPYLKTKKFQVTVKTNGKVRFMYGDDPVVLEMYAKANGMKILKVRKL